MDRTTELLKKSGALLEGHFLLSSGRHSNKYCQCAKLIENPSYCEEVADIIAEKVKKSGIKVDLCVGPAMGGVIIAYEVARSLGVNGIFTERVDGKMKLRRGFSVSEGEKVLLVEDVVTTGKSSFETVKILENSGAEVVALSCIANRTGKNEIDGKKLFAATDLNIESRAEDEIPDFLKDIPVEEPGSRNLKK